MNTLYTNKKSKKYGVSFIVVLIAVVLCFCLLIGSVSAWLIRKYDSSDSNNTIGSVDVRLYASGQEITGTMEEIEGVMRWSCNTPYAITGGQLNRGNIGLTIRNVGTIDALVRATVRVFYIRNNMYPVTEPSNQAVAIISEATPMVAGMINISTEDWIRDFPVASVAAGEMFYSTKVAPYMSREQSSGGSFTETPDNNNDISIIDSIIVSTPQIDTTFYVSVTIDAVAYDGNIYKKIENGETTLDDIPVYALPFGTKESLPETWEAWK